MPVQLLSNDNSEDPRVISLQAYMDGRANFDMHYYYTSAQSSFGGHVNSCQWADLQGAVDNFCASTGIPHPEVALRFVHCFDPVTGKLYLRLQICQMVPIPEPIEGQQVFDLLTTNAAWVEIKEGILTGTNDDELFGAAYLGSFYYKSEPQSQMLQPLTSGPDKFVKNLVFPWENEVFRMYMDNGSPEGAGVHFAACSYTQESPEYANVEWPHGMVIFLSNAAGEDMLDDNDYISIFHNKGADAATLCPPNCNIYISPNI